MKTALILAFVGAGAALASFALASVDPRPQDKPADAPSGEPRRKWPWGTEEEAQRISETMLGAWRLSSVRQGGGLFTGDLCEGYLLVTPEVLSMQARVQQPSSAIQSAYIEAFSAGTYKWRYDLARLKVVIHTLMQASDFTGDVDWEPPGTQREYDIIVNDDSLTLSRGADVEFQYTRLRPTTPAAPKSDRKSPAEGTRPERR